MDKARWERAAGLFDSLCELDGRGRAQRLEAIASEDPQLAAELRTMLEADGGASPLDHGLGELLPRLFGPDAGTETRSGRIGAWQLHERIGRGGMGEVYRASRADGGFAQQAAIKLLKRGMDSGEILRRFLRERRILAALHHPHIAQLYDGGITDDGLPWFAMELVDGQPITDYCKQAGCDLGQRVDLVISVCLAVDFAHRNLVVHRDLKPANVLVDAAGEVKLLDFGIAKLLDDSAGEPQTETGMRVLTPAYAAPEQLRGEPVTTATDVHALGLLLYELLTGGLPPEHSRSDAGAHAPAVTRPSVALRRSGQTRPGARRTARALEGDLDTVVVKALQPEPGRRYHGAAALADDLQRYRSGRPVAARRDSSWYRARKFVARNVALVSVSVLLLLALVGSLAVALWQAERQREQAQLAQAQAERADRSRAFLVSVFQDTSPYRSQQGAALTAAELLAGAAERIETEPAPFPLEQAELRLAIGASLLALGDDAQARPLIERAIAQLRTLPDVPPLVLAGGLQQLTLVLVDYGELAAAEAAAREALGLLRPRTDDAARLMRVQLHTSLAKLANRRGDAERALEAHRKILAERTLMFGDEQDPRLAVDWNNLGSTHLREHQYSEAAAAYRRARALLVAEGGERQARIVWVEVGLGAAASGAGDHAEATAALDRAERLAAELLPEGHFITGLLANARSLLHLRQGDVRLAADAGARATSILGAAGHVLLSSAQINHGQALLRLGHNAEAARVLAAAEAALEKEEGGASSRLQFTRALRGLALISDGKVAQGEPMLRDAIDALARSGREGEIELAETRLLLAQLQERRGETQAAAAQRQRAADILAARLGATHPRVRALRPAVADR